MYYSACDMKLTTGI